LEIDHSLKDATFNKYETVAEAEWIERLPEECIGHNSKLVMKRMFSEMTTGTPPPYPASL
jgi:hypothetical protein